MKMSSKEDSRPTAQKIQWKNLKPKPRHSATTSMSRSRIDGYRLPMVRIIFLRFVHYLQSLFCRFSSYWDRFHVTRPESMLLSQRRPFYYGVLVFCHTLIPPLRMSPQTPRPFSCCEQSEASSLHSDANIHNFALVARIMKTALPDNAKIAKEAKECMQECVSEFISFITSEGIF